MRLSTPAFLFVAFACASSAAMASGQVTSRVSVGEHGVEGDHDSADAAISANGRYVAFVSLASNLVPGDTNNVMDIFVRDRALRTTTRVSVDSSGVQGNGDSYQPEISADGRFVAFISRATNLAFGDSSSLTDVFVHDRATGVTSRVSVDSNGVPGNLGSFAPSISAGGRFVAFSSDATNLVAGDTNAQQDVFVHDRVHGTTTRVSLSSAGGEGTAHSGAPSISADGSRVAFASRSSLVPGDIYVGGLDIYVRDLANATTVCASVKLNGAPCDNVTESRISGDGRFVSFVSGSTNLVPGDTNNCYDVFVRDLAALTTKRVSVGTNGVQSDAHSWYHSISYRGRFVAFASAATSLASTETNALDDIFVRDVHEGVTRLVSQNSFGVPANHWCRGTVISLSGKHIVFDGEATNLAHGDTNGSIDVFVSDLP